MAFFCDCEVKNNSPGDGCGARIVAPGRSVGCGGPVPAHDGTAYAAAAEHAADCELAKHRDARGETRISPEIERACLGAAMAVLAKPIPEKGEDRRPAVRSESKGAGKPASQ